MAHEIDQTTGRAAVFVTGEPAWHRLGTVIEQATTSAEAIGLAGLDWNVAQWPIRAFNPDNQSIEAGIPDTVAKHTAWGAYNAVSEWADHQRKYRGASPADKLDRQLDSVWFGQSHQLKQAAYRGALELAGVL